MEQDNSLVQTVNRPELVTEPALAAWIGPTEDYESERRYGDWVDLSARTPDVMATIGGIIDRSPRDAGQQWQVCELRGFAGWQPTEHEGLDTVLQIARGIAINGPAYGALAARLGADSNALRHDKYRLSYIGDWPSLRDFVDTVAFESGWYEQLDRLPPSMQPYVRLDVPKLMRAVAHDLTVIEHEQGVWIYDPRVW